MNKPADKTVLRGALREARRAYAAQAGTDAAHILGQTVPDILRDCALTPPAVIAAYYPLSDEIDPRLLMDVLRTRGYRTALPVTQGCDAALFFRLCVENTPLVRSDFGVFEPAAGEVVIPDVILVPLLGFDRACHRLGYGAGHYDRTLAALRENHDILAAGLAFDVQRLETDLPVEEHDQPLDCVITDKGLYWPDHAI